jgi:Spy/CpxP family protein refolding chaperone
VAPHQLERLLDGANVSAEQRTQIKQITEAARADLQAQHEAGRQLHEQQRALLAQPTVDERAVETLRQQMLAQHDQASKRMTQAMLEVSRVLTPEQRKTLAERMAQRRDMMERHRAERAAIDPPPQPH